MRAAILTVSLVLLSLPLVPSGQSADQPRRGAAWPQWGGPDRNFIVDSPPLADRWPDEGPPVLWRRPLGTGHSAIVSDGERLFTMYRVGNGRARQGPWDAEEIVIALDAATGKTLWEHKYPSRREDFSFGAGPHSTPILVGDRLFTIGTNKQLFAFDKATGTVLWSHDLIAEFRSPDLLIRPVVKTGYGCSPIAYRDLIICSAGGPGQSVMAFRQSDGTVVWKSGHFLTSEAPPILIALEGRPQLVFLAGGTVQGLDPETGQVLWAHPHDPGNDLNCGTPLWGGDGIVFVSSAYKAGSRAIQLRPEGNATHADELWFTNRVRFMFLNAVRLGEYIYGTTGDFGPAFLTALNIRTGEAAWQHRGFGRASLIYADEKAIIMDEDGDLALARISPQGVTVLAEAKIFDTTSWTVPTLVGTALYARDREQIVALDLGRAGQVARVGQEGQVGQVGRVGHVESPIPPTRQDSPVLSGTWRLDRASSRVSDAAGLAGLIAAGAPDTLHVTQPANGTLIIESQINEGHARMYRPGGKTTTPAGQGGTITMASRWEGGTLVSEGTLQAASGVATAVREATALAADGRALVIDVTTKGVDTHTSTLRYVPVDDVGPCASWPTPCKRLP